MCKCPFCNVDSNNILYETNTCKAIFDQYPVSEGHVLIIPNEHVNNWFELDYIVQKDMICLLNKVKDFLESTYHPDGFNVGFNIGESAGQSVNHCHVHVIPRYKGDVENPRGGIRGVIPSKQNY